MAKSANEFCAAIDAYMRNDIAWETCLAIMGEGHEFRSVSKWPAPKGNPTQCETLATFNQGGRGPY